MSVETFGGPTYEDRIRAVERERCARIVRVRAAKWNQHAKAGHPGDCAESLADECEDILAAILKSE